MTLVRLCVFSFGVLLRLSQAADVPVTLDSSSRLFEWTGITIGVNGTYNAGQITFRGTVTNRSEKELMNVVFCVKGVDPSGRMMEDKYHPCLLRPDVWNFKPGATERIEQTGDIRLSKFGKGPIKVSRFLITQVGEREYQPPTTNRRTFTKPCDDVWSASVPLLADNGFHPQSADRATGIITLAWVKGQSVYPDAEYDASRLTGSRPELLHRFTGFRMTSGTFTVTPTSNGCLAVMRVTYAAYKAGVLYEGWVSLDSNNELEGAVLDAVSKTLSGDREQSTTMLSAPISAPSSVSITSLPTGAEIEIDGMFVGTTPSQLSAKPGEHVVSIRKSGYIVWVKKILIQQDSKVSLHADLERLGLQLQ